VEQLLIRTLFERMSEDRRDLAHLECAREIVIFGSYAAALHTPESDIDVLCIGSGPRLKSHSLDLLWVPENKLDDDQWLGSELAGHIAKYGIWARGDGFWRGTVFSGAHAIERKRKRIISLSRTATHFWNRLHSIFQDQYDVSIRRELQRLALLVNHVQIPPTKVLDDEWVQGNRESVFELRSSLMELRSYEGQSNVPTILKLSA
jgi:predicted nucleotidyltransferase